MTARTAAVHALDRSGTNHGVTPSDRPGVLAAVTALRNTVNTLAFRYLWPAGREDQDDAWTGLLGCCWRAKGNLYVASEDGRSVLLATRGFIEDELAEYLSRYKRLTRTKIADMALVGEFRYVARTIRNRMADQVRKVYRDKAAAQTPGPVPYEPSPHEQPAILVNLRAAEGRAVEQLGRGPYEALVAVAKAWPVAKTRRERKSRVTAAIMAARAVSHQQATKDRSNMLYRIAQSHDPYLIVLRASAWFRYAFNLRLEARLRFDKNLANRFISEGQKREGTAQSGQSPAAWHAA
jgi:hypothetical protein